MKYRLQMNITEEDLYQCKIFALLHTPAGKQEIRRERIKVAVAFVIWVACAFLFDRYDNLEASLYVYLAVFAVMEALWQIFLIKTMKSRTKRNVKRIYKQEEMAGKTDVLEFYEDGIVELYNQVRTEVEYSSLQRAVIYNNRYLFLLLNTGGFAIPYTAFQDEAQAAEVVAFLQNRGVTVETVDQ